MTPFPDHENWIQTLEGGAYSFTSGRFASAPSIYVIARALSQLNRYTGHTSEPYSVAQHSVIVADLIGNDVEAKMYGLAHDAHEALIGDISSPLKRELKALGAGHALHWLESRADEAIFPVFGLAFPMPARIRKVVRTADLIALATERESLIAPGYDWKLEHRPAPFKIKPWHPAHAEYTYLKCFRFLEMALKAGREAAKYDGKSEPLPYRMRAL